MKIGPITREQALKIDPKYVKFAENKATCDDREHIYNVQDALKRGQFVLTVALNDRKQFIIARVSKVDSTSFQAVDGPVIRVMDNEYSWRVDGNTFCVPV